MYVGGGRARPLAAACLRTSSFAQKSTRSSSARSGDLRGLSVRLGAGRVADERDPAMV